MQELNQCFDSASSWDEAELHLAFRPLRPPHTAGCSLQSLRIHVRGLDRRDLPIAERTLEAHYGRFVFSQSMKGEAEARRWALDVSYGQTSYEATIGHRAARVYELGPEVPPEDIDGRNPSVVAWHDEEMFYLIASGELLASELLEIATRLYA